MLHYYNFRIDFLPYLCIINFVYRPRLLIKISSSMIFTSKSMKVQEYKSLRVRKSKSTKVKEYESQRVQKSKSTKVQESKSIERSRIPERPGSSERLERFERSERAERPESQKDQKDLKDQKDQNIFKNPGQYFTKRFIDIKRYTNET